MNQITKSMENATILDMIADFDAYQLKIKFRPSLGAKEMIFSKKEKPKTVAQEPGAGGEETESTVCDEFMGSLKRICNKGGFSVVSMVGFFLNLPNFCRLT